MVQLLVRSQKFRISIDEMAGIVANLLVHYNRLYIIKVTAGKLKKGKRLHIFYVLCCGSA